MQMSCLREILRNPPKNRVRTARNAPPTSVLSSTIWLLGSEITLATAPLVPKRIREETNSGNARADLSMHR